MLNSSLGDILLVDDTGLHVGELPVVLPIMVAVDECSVEQDLTSPFDPLHENVPRSVFVLVPNDAHVVYGHSGQGDCHAND